MTDGLDPDEGFTLVELLVVLIILGVLAGIVVLSIGGVVDRGTRSACRTSLKYVEVAQQAYYAKTTPQGYAIEVGALITAGLLRSAPDSTQYAITTDATGSVLVHVPSVTSDPSGGDMSKCDGL